MMTQFKSKRSNRLFFGCMVFITLILSLKANALTITTNTTWTTSQTITGDLVIDNNATLTITGAAAIISVTENIVVKPGCKLIVEDYAIIKTGINIILENSNEEGTDGAVLETSNHVILTALNTKWNGVQVWGQQAYGLEGTVASAILNHTTIEKAKVGIVACKTDYQSSATNTNRGGIIKADWCTFQDNKTGAYVLENPKYAAQSPNGPIISIPVNSDSYFKFCKFYFLNTDYFPLRYIGLHVEDAKGVSVLGCTFKNNIENEYLIVGIRATNSDVRIAPGSVTTNWGDINLVYTNPTKFINMPEGIENQGPKAFNRFWVIQTIFQNNEYGINVSGGNQSYFERNQFTDMNHWFGNGFGITIMGSTAYDVMLNNIEGGLDDNYAPSGIYVRNSGADYNLIYKNVISNVGVGIQFVGKNRNAGGTIGLELQCNDMHSNDWEYSTGLFGLSAAYYNTPYAGIAEYQGTILPNQNGYTFYAAGNLFASQQGLPGYNYKRIFVDPGVQPFTYAYSNASPYENPVDVSPNVALQLANPNECPDYASKPFISYASYLSHIRNVEEQINVYTDFHEEPLQRDDSIRLAGLWRVHQKIIDSMLHTYMYLSNTVVSYDSMAMALEAVNLGYFNKIKLAGVYLTQLRYSDAINLLSELPGYYNLEAEEANDVLDMRDMYVVIDTLAHNGDNWDDLPATVKQNVAIVADGNGAYGTPVARYLLGRYEGIIYHPEEQQLNGGASSTMFAAAPQSDGNKIYPNPAGHQVLVEWQSKGRLALRLYDLSGNEVLQTKINSGRTQISIEKLESGIYLAKIYEDGHSVYQQKIIKK